MMAKTKNTDEEALAIFVKVPTIVAKNDGFIIVHFYDGSRKIGIFQFSTSFSSNNLPASSLPHKSTLDLKDAYGKVNSYDFYTIKDLD